MWRLSAGRCSRWSSLHRTSFFSVLATLYKAREGSFAHSSHASKTTPSAMSRNVSRRNEKSKRASARQARSEETKQANKQTHIGIINMKLIVNIILAVAAFLAVTGSLKADVFVNGYTRSNGTPVESHYRTSPNNTKSDNYSSGAYNPHKW